MHVSHWLRSLGRVLVGVGLLGLTGTTVEASNSFVVDAQGVLAAACDVTVADANVPLLASADLRSLEGTTQFNLASTADYNLSISSLTVTRPADYTNYQASVVLSRGTVLVTNNSEAGATNSQLLPGPILFDDGVLLVRIEGLNNTILKAGQYRVQATITCTVVG
jgi:hypothetical protein